LLSIGERFEEVVSEEGEYDMPDNLHKFCRAELFKMPRRAFKLPVVLFYFGSDLVCFDDLLAGTKDP